MLGTIYHQNPRDLVPGWAFDVVNTWRLCRGDFGQSWPDPGGLNQQAAWLVDAFGVCNAAEAELTKVEKPED